MKTLFLALAFASLLTGCASPVALTLDQSGKPVVYNKTGKCLHDVSIRIAAGTLDGRTAFEDFSIADWQADDWRQAATIRMRGIVAMEAKGESREVKNLRASWRLY